MKKILYTSLILSIIGTTIAFASSGTNSKKATDPTTGKTMSHSTSNHLPYGRQHSR